MAGDTKNVDSAEQVAAPNFDNPFPGIQGTLTEILDALRGAAPGEVPSTFDLSTVAGAFGQHQWQRLRVSWIVVSASAAGTFTLTIGAFLRTWNIGVGVSPPIMFPYVIERGTDVVIGGSAAGLTAYLIGTPE